MSAEKARNTGGSAYMEGKLFNIDFLICKRHEEEIKYIKEQIGASSEIVDIIDKYWEEFNRKIDDVFAGKKVTIRRFK